MGKSASREAFPLPIVLPIVFYTGWQRWQGPQNISELIDSGSDLWKQANNLRYKYILLDVFRTVPKGEPNSLIWLLVDCLRTNHVDKLRQKWFNLRKVLPELGHPVYQEAWIQLMSMVYRNLKEEDMSTELTIDTIYPRVTKEDDIDDLLDADGNVINWRKRYLDEGRAEGKQQNQNDAIRQVLRFKFSTFTDKQFAAIFRHCDEDNLLTRILQADTLEGLLNELRGGEQD